MNDNIKLEVAIEILATMIANATRKGNMEDSLEMKQLLLDKRKMYEGDTETIDKIIYEYGEIIKKKFEEE